METTVENMDVAPIETTIEEDVAGTVENGTKDPDPGSVKFIKIEALQKIQPQPNKPLYHLTPPHSVSEL